jgi:chaperonin GroEL (HSP60 family)
VAHKKMKAKVQNPRILLLSSSLEFQRTARFSSFDALLQQEKQHLQIVVNKIAALKPDVVVVEKTVSRLALEFLLKVTRLVSFVSFCDCDCDCDV